LGFETHVRSDYGDEGACRTPWELFDRTSANEAVTLAESARSRIEDIERVASKENKFGFALE
jgi:hypothetical protein